MNPTEKCPFCGSTKVTAAEIREADGSRGILKLHYSQVNARPRGEDDCGGQEADHSIYVDTFPTVCLACGMLWARYDLLRARKTIENDAPAKFKAALAASAAERNEMGQDKAVVSNDPTFTSELPASVVDLIRRGAGSKIAAIKELRSCRPGLGLAEAKRMVEGAATRMGMVNDAKSGCFVATACYGNYDHPVVLELRRFRDDALEQSIAGRILVRWYYQTAPVIAKLVARSELLKFLARVLIVGPALCLARISLAGQARSKLPRRKA